MTRSEPGTTPDPYRVLFPLGLLFGLIGAALWPLHAMGLVPYPGPTHRALMIQGFEHCFILGFLLTAMPSFLHAERARRTELGFAVGCMTAFAVLLFTPWAFLAHAAYLLTLLLLVFMGARRFRRVEPPPEEFLFVGFGLILGGAGAVLRIGEGSIPPPAAAGSFALHAISFGMVLSLVLGVGSLLVPTFSAMREPLVIPGLARPHERRPRRLLYALLVLALLAALALEWIGLARAGAWTRAAAATVVLLWVWKIYRIPRARDLVARALWTAGWMILAGLWLTAFVPEKRLLGYHVVFIGGFSLLTLGIATRVIVRHGRHSIAAEARVLRWGVVGGLILALLARLAAELAPVPYLALLGLSGACWVIAWLGWGGAAAPLIARVGNASSVSAPASARLSVSPLPAPTGSRGVSTPSFPPPP